jgi:uncharacterized protein YjbI with pentapeptide repeats
MAASHQRWRTPFIVVLAGAAGLAAGSTTSWRGLAGFAIIAGVALAGALVAWVVIMPTRLAPPVPTQDLAQITELKARLEATDARLRLRHDLRNGALQTLAVVAVLAGAMLGFQQLAEDRSNAAADRELTRQGQASERFTRAISQLGDKKRVETRIGGIYGLAQVAEQAPDNNGPVGEVLLAYLNRLPRPRRWPTVPLSQHAPDVQAALTVLSQHDKNHDGTKDYAWLVRRLDLHNLSLGGANLGLADLSGANLFGTDLGGNADLHDADLHSATLSRADLTGANLSGANLQKANFGAADLSGANLRSADLSGADLSGASLSSLQFSGANLKGASLRGADLRAAELRGVDLSGADLRGADLRSATADDRTKWPKGFDLRRAGVKVT